MIVTFDKSFSKRINKLKNKAVALKIIKVIEECEKAKSLTDIAGIKKMVGYDKFYRIKIADYRIGIELVNKDTIDFIVVAHRKDIYNMFP